MENNKPGEILQARFDATRARLGELLVQKHLLDQEIEAAWREMSALDGVAGLLKSPWTVSQDT